jgi:hypothetical protein
VSMRNTRRLILTPKLSRLILTPKLK